MKQRLITLIVAILGLTVGLWQAPNVDASSTNRVIKTTNLTKSAYLTKNTQGGFYNMSGAANNLKIQSRGTLRQYGNTTWFVTQQRQIRLANNTTANYYFITSANTRVRGWVKTGSSRRAPDLSPTSITWPNPNLAIAMSMVRSVRTRSTVPVTLSMSSSKLRRKPYHAWPKLSTDNIPKFPNSAPKKAI